MYAFSQQATFNGLEGHSSPVNKIFEGNVKKLRIIPPDHKGDPAKGHLIFDACFECGNLGRVDYVSDCEYDLFIRPDTSSPRHRVWFYFSVENVKLEQKVLFNVVNFSKTRSLYREGMAPVVKSNSRPKWQRIPSRHAHYDKSPAHNDQHVISFAFAFDREDDVYYFAYCFPYTYTDLQRYLSSLEDLNFGSFYRELLATSEQGRRLDLITITDAVNRDSNRIQRIIFITARVHSGESPASIICQGLIDFLISNNPIAISLRENFVFKIIPMLNPDGVYLGNGRCSSLGYDLNRQWEKPVERLQPTILATKNLLEQYKDNPRTRLDFFIDMHSHSQQLNSFMYGNEFSNDPSRSERQTILPSLLSEIAVDFSLDFTQFNKDPVKAGTGRRVMAEILDDESICYTLEVSVFGYRRNGEPSEIIPYTEEAYQKLGSDIACAFYQYLEVERGTRTMQIRSSPITGHTVTAPENATLARKNSNDASKNIIRAYDNRKLRFPSDSYVTNKKNSNASIYKSGFAKNDYAILQQQTSAAMDEM